MLIVFRHVDLYSDAADDTTATGRVTINGAEGSPQTPGSAGLYVDFGRLQTPDSETTNSIHRPV